MKRLIVYLIIAAATIIVGSAAIFQVESYQENPQIVTYLDALWWSVSTITTVGYGDLVPISDAGKIVGIVYMLFGIGILAVIVKALVSDITSRKGKKETEINSEQKLILQKIQELEKKSENQDKLFKEIIEKLNEINSKEK